MQVFLAALIIVIGAALIIVGSVKFYKYETAREKRILGAIRARHAAQHALLDEIVRNMNSGNEVRNQIQSALAKRS